VLFKENKNCFQPCLQIKNYFFSHAGLTKGYFKQLRTKVPKKFVEFDKKNYAKYLVEVFKNIPDYLNDVSFYRGGMSDFGGIFWADAREVLDKGSIPTKLNQVIGHTPMKTITKHHNGQVVFCDCLEHGDGSVYTFEIGGKKNGK
jgi:hypothetical protein